MYRWKCAVGRACTAQSPPELRPLPYPTCRLQELYYEIVHVLNLMLEDLPQKKQFHSSDKVDET